jgi:FkbM family methyltransferase
MSIADRALAMFEHYANAVFVRTYVLRELLRAKRRGNQIHLAIMRDAIFRPRWQEDFVLLLRFFDSNEEFTLIDVGANDGQWTKKFLTIYPKATAIAIEPLPANFARLSALLGNDKRVTTLNVAAGELAGTLELFVNADDSSGVGVSAYRYNSAITNYSDQTTILQVPMRTLDQIVDEYKHFVHDRVVLKIDVQGHEANVLKGAVRLLARVAAAHIEVALFQYDGQEHGLTVLVPILSAAGLHLGPYQQCIGRSLSRYPYEVDMVFVRKEALPRLLGY